MRTTVTHSPEQWGEILRAQGLRATSGRIAALGYIQEHPHTSVGDIHAALEAAAHELPEQSVRNIANDLTACGILRRIDLPDTGSALFEITRGDNHHHVQCVICQRIEDIDCVVGEAPCLTPAHTHGMRLLEAAVTFRGVCAACDTGAAPAD